MNWIEEAARKIDAMLGDAVRENTGIQNGYFSGVSIRDIMNVIEEAAQQGETAGVCQHTVIQLHPSDWIKVEKRLYWICSCDEDFMELNRQDRSVCEFCGASRPAKPAVSQSARSGR